MSPKNVRVSLGALFFMLSKQALDEFKKIYKAEYGENITDKKVADLATNLLVFFNHIYRPVKKSWLKEFVDKIVTKK